MTSKYRKRPRAADGRAGNRGSLSGSARGGRRAFRSDAQLADALGVDRAQVTRGREGRTTPGVEAAARLVGLDAGVELLSSCLEAASIPRWLQGVKVHLDNIRPIDLLRQGRLSPVIAAIEAMKSHSFA